MDLIYPYKIHKKVNKSLSVIKYVTMIDSVTELFKKIQYNNKKVITIAKLLETT